MKAQRPPGFQGVAACLAGYLGKRESAAYLGLSVRTVEKNLDGIPHFRVGRKLLFRKSELDRFMEQHREAATGADLGAIADEVLAKVRGGSK